MPELAQGQAYLCQVLYLPVLQARVLDAAPTGEIPAVSKLPCYCLVEDFLAVVAQPQPEPERVGAVPAVAVKDCHRHDGRVPSPEFLALHQALAVHKRIQDTYKGASLAGVVLYVKQLVAAEARGAQAVLDIGLVALQRPFAAGLVERVRLPAQTVLLEALAKDFKVVGVEHAGIFWELAVVRVYLELTVFVAHDGRIAKRYYTAEVICRSRPVPVEYATLVRIGKGE